MHNATVAAPKGWSGTKPRTGLALLTVCLAQLVGVLSFQGASISLPEIERALGLTSGTAQWVISANALAFGGFVLVGGRAADLFGHRRLFLVGLALFAAASLAVGLAPGAGWLIAARAVQGLATALFVPASLALLTGAFPDGPARHRALAAWGAAGPIGGMAAVLGGGALAGVLGWRAIFLLAVPFALVALALTPGGFPRESVRLPGRLNPWSTIAGTGGFTLLIFGLSETSRAGLASGPAIASLALGAGLVAVFLAIERRANYCLLPSALMKRGRTIGAVAVSFLLGGATNTALVFFALYVQQVRGGSVLDSGLGFLPCNLAIIASSAAAGRLAGRIGMVKVMALGMAIVAGGLVALTMMSVDGAYIRTLLPGLVIVGLGHGLVQIGTVGTAAAAASPEDQGIAAGLITTAAQLGTAAGLVLLVAIAITAGGATPEALVAGYRAAYLGAAGLALLGVLAALLASSHARQDRV